MAKLAARVLATAFQRVRLANQGFKWTRKLAWTLLKPIQDSVNSLLWVLPLYLQILRFNDCKVIYGQSLGGAVAIDVTSRNHSAISALIVENTFTSVPGLVKEWPMGRFLSLFITERWTSADKISCLPPRLPILMLSGLRDVVIPPKEMDALWKVAQARQEKKQSNWSSFVFTCSSDSNPEEIEAPQKDTLKTFSRGSHSAFISRQLYDFMMTELLLDDTCLQRGYWDAVRDFLDRAIPSSELTP